MKIQKIMLVRRNIFIVISGFPIINSFPLIQNGQIIFGTLLLLFGGWIGLLLILFSNKLVKNLNISKAFIFGVSGCALLIFNLLFILFLVRYPISNYTFVFYYDIFGTIFFCVIFRRLLHYQKTLKESNDETLIRKMILDFGTKLTRLKVDEIAERTETFHKTIIEVVNNMIENREIYARYFKSSNSVVFNQEKNIIEIDALMSIYSEWEKSKIEKA